MSWALERDASDRAWLRVAAAGVGVLGLLVVLSLGTRLLAYRLQEADPGSAPIAAAAPGPSASRR